MISMMSAMLKKYFYRPEWKNIEYFDENWKSRIKAMAELIENERIILDIGCGRMWLKDFLDSSKVYLGCDFVKRNDDTIVCNLNDNQFPEIKADLCFVSGCFEYVENIEWFLDKLEACAPALIISYCTRDLNPDLKLRKSMGWVNHLSFQEIVRMIASRGFSLVKRVDVIDGNEILKFVRQAIPAN